MIHIDTHTPEDWDSFVSSCPDGSFLQSASWFSFYRSMRRDMYCAWDEGEKGGIAAGGVFEVRSLPFGGCYGYVARGPLGTLSDDFWSELLSFFRKKRCLFLRIEPLEVGDISFFKKFRRVVDVQPSATRMLNLDLSEKELLAAMHTKTRYNIRLALKKGVSIQSYVSGNVPEGVVNTFLNLLSKTSSRTHFGLHPADYYRSLLRKYTDTRLYVASHEGEAIAAILVSWFGGRAVYMHGASDHAYRRVMAPYALQWRAVSDAREAGMAVYDFWGVAPEGVSGHPLAGVTRFKEGFGGKYVAYPGCFDIPLRSFGYMFYRALRTVRRWF